MTDKRKVMIVDDDEAIISYLVVRLSKFYEVVSTTDPTKAVALARVEHPAIILCDIDMPEMSGGELAGLLSEDVQTRTIPLIYLTGLVSPDETRESGGLVGGRPGVAKRAPLGELVQKINALIQ